MRLHLEGRVPLRDDTPVIRRVLETAPKWSPQRRLRVALANDNGGAWYVVISRRSVADLERRFIEGSMAGLLYEVVGGIVGDHTGTIGRRFPLFMQLSRVDDDIRMCLGETGVTVGMPTEFKQIQHY